MPSEPHAMSFHRFVPVVALSLGLVGVLAAQTPTPAATPAFPELKKFSDKPYQTMNMQANLGSFKLINGEGQIVFRFSGTVMLNGYEGTAPKIEGNIKRELERFGRQVYFGTGTMTLEGKWRGIQWFGRDLTYFRWHGHGIARLVGEFDKDQNIGQYWYSDRTNDKKYWYAQSITVTLPEQTFGATAQPRARGGTGASAGTTGGGR
jgi:hypothetical protein